MAKIMVSGATGLVGSELLPLLQAGDYGVSRLVREYSAVDGGDVFWDPVAGELDTAALEGVEAVVHLAGENIAAGRWNNARKKRIRESRVDGTKLLCAKLAEMPTPPKVLICASAIGYYGERGDEELAEEAAAGEGFLPDVCREWEESTEAAATAGIQTFQCDALPDTFAISVTASLGGADAGYRLVINSASSDNCSPSDANSSGNRRSCSSSTVGLRGKS